MIQLPDGVIAYKRTPQFDECTVPAGLLRSHTTKEGVWGRIRVERGTLTYRILEPHVSEQLLAPDRDGIVEPTVPHEVELTGPVSFHVEFYR